METGFWKGERFPVPVSRPLRSGSSCQKMDLIYYFIWLSVWKSALGCLSFATPSDGIYDIPPTHYTCRNSCWHSCFHLSEILQLYTISDLAKHSFWKLYSLSLGSSLQCVLMGVKSPSLPCSLCQSCFSINCCVCPWTSSGHEGWVCSAPGGSLGLAKHLLFQHLPFLQGLTAMFSWLAAWFSWGFISLWSVVLVSIAPSWVLYLLKKLRLLYLLFCPIPPDCEEVQVLRVVLSFAVQVFLNCFPLFCFFLGFFLNSHFHSFLDL